ncbi:tetraacyldisaccharide 4'-kinase [Hellea sp.]|jgi:tetraacyldisaccharide 4'-kinase|nr:tetraacyldisaccharide 4'-kinase [Hellea sp.]MBT7398242.1 tetraacyldisaccharide 4'-kinase [Hellea sp.]MDA8888423.1 tetraacyldisaccharide 4'-kinase [Hellea sp.]MDC1062530.1 tetraacyldisaccharide 4'-kinase [Hellea sp.]
MRAPEFWSHKSGRESAPAIRTILSPIGWLYGKFVSKSINNSIPYNSGIPVICVGNATLGGTGKTPVTIYILKSLRRLGLNAVGLTRGYGGQEKGPILLNDKHTSNDVGDEPLLLAKYAPVWVAAGRDDGAKAAVSNGASIIVMDDGHQNQILKKSLSLLVVDAEVGFGNGKIFPAGPLRENLDEALNRSDAIILMKPNKDYKPDNFLLDQLSKKVLINAYLKPTSILPKGKLYAFAGIGRPNKFFDSLRDSGGEIVEAISYSNHYKYKDIDIENLFTLASEYKASLITTEKDYVRLPRGYRKGVHKWPVTVHFEDELTLRRLLHPFVKQPNQ